MHGCHVGNHPFPPATSKPVLSRSTSLRRSEIGTCNTSDTATSRRPSMEDKRRNLDGFAPLHLMATNSALFRACRAESPCSDPPIRCITAGANVAFLPSSARSNNSHKGLRVRLVESPIVLEDVNGRPASFSAGPAIRFQQLRSVVHLGQAAFRKRHVACPIRAVGSLRGQRRRQAGVRMMSSQLRLITSLRCMPQG